MEVLLTFTYSVLFYFIIRRSKFFNIHGISPYLPGIVFLLKCVSGILLGLLYTYYYTNHEDADSFKFFTDSKIIFDTLITHPYDFVRMFTGIGGKSPDLLHYYMEMNAWLNESPIYNDNRTIVRLNTLFRFFSLGNYYVHVVFLNFISFTGLFCLYKSFVDYLPSKKIELFLLTFLMPSMLFWGSGLLKDGLLIAGFGIFVYAFSQIINKGLSVRRILILLIGLTILIFTKAYVIMIIAPGLIAWWLTRRWTNFVKIFSTYLILYGTIIVIAFNLYHFKDEYNVAAVIFYKQKNFVEIAEQHAARIISPIDFECSGPSILTHSPKAFFNTMFRPFFGDANGNPLVMMSVMENLLLAILMVLIFLSFRKPETGNYSFMMFNFCLVLFLFVLIGLITPILGAIVRYRIIALPSLMFLLLNFYDREKLRRRLKIFRTKEHS